jgi:hypothetical protein
MENKLDDPLPMSGTSMTGPLPEPINWLTDPGAVATVTFSQPKMNWLTLMPSGIRINTETGEVVIPEGLTISDAAQEFWDAVQLISGHRKIGFAE